MNVDSLKSELQQVLESDMALRKEFNDLKRSLSDYRNLLIMRDEDCKRLQVNIDVLNTKLAVMERDNTQYKAELASFRELRGTINEQLQAKQDEIDARIEEIQSLRNDLNSIVANYEQQIAELRSNNEVEIQHIHSRYEQQIEALKTTETAIRAQAEAEFRLKLNELNGSWEKRESELIGKHDSEISALRSAHESQLSGLSIQYQEQLDALAGAGQREVQLVTRRFEQQLSESQITLMQRVSDLENRYSTDMEAAQSKFQSERESLVLEHERTIGELRESFARSEEELTAGHATQVAELSAKLESYTNVDGSHEQQLTELESKHEQLLAATLAEHEQKINSIVNSYEEKLSLTLIHANQQNSKLSEELNRYQEQQDLAIAQLNETISNQTVDIESLTSRLRQHEAQLQSEEGRLVAAQAELDDLRKHAAQSESEKIQELSEQMARLNQSHSIYVDELHSTIETLQTEIGSVTTVFEGMTNQLADAETRAEQTRAEYEASLNRIAELELALSASDSRNMEEREAMKRELEARVEQKEAEFGRLLAENAHLIAEIETVQANFDQKNQEYTLLKTEMDEFQVKHQQCVEDFKETISEKNFRITNLEANVAGMTHEIGMLKKSNIELEERLRDSTSLEERLVAVQDELTVSEARNTELLAEIEGMRQTISELNGKMSIVDETLRSAESKLQTEGAEEQEEFIARLFKQIDVLNDERLVLLNEKEQMALQLLKMNEVISGMSQQVDNEHIDVQSLNNHRKNVILASNSSNIGDHSSMKKQINELVREIDKCISLLSA